MFSLRYFFRRKISTSYHPVILITGCSTGLGAAMAELLYAKTNYKLVLTARQSSLDQLHQRFQESDRVWIRPLDVTINEERQKLLTEIEQNWRGVDILINNAGISYRAVVEHMSEAEEHHQMEVNYFGPLALIRLVLPHMREQGRGKIINVSSVSGMLAMPTMASYSASKYAMEGMSEALWYESKPFGINVSLVQPGFIHSNSFKKVYYSKISQIESGGNGAYSDFYKFMTPFVERLMNRSLTNPAIIAKLVLRVIRSQNPPLWIPASLDAWVFYYLRRIIPRRLLMPLLFYALPGAKHWGEKHTHRRK